MERGVGPLVMHSKARGTGKVPVRLPPGVHRRARGIEPVVDEQTEDPDG